MENTQKTTETINTRRRRARTTRRPRNRNRVPPPPQNTPWTGVADWPQEEFQKNHCLECHFEYEGTYHGWCQRFPGLDLDTCPTCNQFSGVDPRRLHPFLFLFDTQVVSYFEPSLIKVVWFFDNFEYLPFWQKAFCYYIILTTAFVTARLF